MAFESLTDKLQNVFKGLRSKGVLTEADVKTALMLIAQRKLYDPDFTTEYRKAHVAYKDQV